LHPFQYVWAKGIIICYDINNDESFKNTAVVSRSSSGVTQSPERFAELPTQHKATSTLHESAPVLVLAGLKKDLRREGPGLGLSGFLEQPKQVTTEEVCHSRCPPLRDTPSIQPNP